MSLILTFTFIFTCFFYFGSFPQTESTPPADSSSSQGFSTHDAEVNVVDDRLLLLVSSHNNKWQLWKSCFEFYTRVFLLISLYFMFIRVTSWSVEPLFTKLGFGRET